MGSDSDLKVMSKAAVMLEELGIDYEMTIISAHREPDELIEWTRSAEGRGMKVMIAGAGMAAALPGMCAALFALPVIGVPLSGKNLDGMDAVFSIMQMPPGVPVATVAIDGAKNAAILAAKILAASDDALLQKLKDYSAEQIAEILEESLDTIQPIYDIALRQAPDYNTDKVFEELNSNK
jgi:5-(carboxyamino)imidazole ribonucleotide mutase